MRKRLFVVLRVLWVLALLDVSLAWAFNSSRFQNLSCEFKTGDAFHLDTEGASIALGWRDSNQYGPTLANDFAIELLSKRFTGTLTSNSPSDVPNLLLIGQVPILKKNPPVRSEAFGFTFERCDASPAKSPSLLAGLFGHQRRIDIAVPFWFMELLLGLPVVYWIIKWRRAKRPPTGFCQKCGYDLRASPERCPECGLLKFI